MTNSHPFQHLGCWTAPMLIWVWQRWAETSGACWCIAPLPAWKLLQLLSVAFKGHKTAFPGCDTAIETTKQVGPHMHNFKATKQLLLQSTLLHIFSGFTNSQLRVT